MRAPDARARPSLQAVVEQTAAMFGIDAACLADAGRTAAQAEVRFAAVWVARTALGASWPTIGRALNRKHQTAVHAFRRAESRRLADPQFRARTDALVARFGGDGG